MLIGLFVMFCAATPPGASIRVSAARGVDAHASKTSKRGRSGAKPLISQDLRRRGRIDGNWAAGDRLRRHPARGADRNLSVRTLIQQNIRRINEGQHKQGKRASGSERQAIARPADVEKPGYRSAQGGGSEAKNNPQDKEQLGIYDRLIANQQEYSKAYHDQRGQRCRNAVKLRARRANRV